MAHLGRCPRTSPPGRRRSGCRRCRRCTRRRRPSAGCCRCLGRPPAQMRERPTAAPEAGGGSARPQPMAGARAPARSPPEEHAWRSQKGVTPFAASTGAATPPPQRPPHRPLAPPPCEWNVLPWQANGTAKGQRARGTGGRVAGAGGVAVVGRGAHHCGGCVSRSERRDRIPFHWLPSCPFAALRGEGGALAEKATA